MVPCSEGAPTHVSRNLPRRGPAHGARPAPAHRIAVARGLVAAAP